jgi:hypothetical protein
MNYQTMNYDFFLFTKLWEEHFDNELEYDLYFEKLCKAYESWSDWDSSKGFNMGTYESINNWIKLLYQQ